MQYFLAIFYSADHITIMISYTASGPAPELPDRAENLGKTLQRVFTFKMSNY